MGAIWLLRRKAMAEGKVYRDDIGLRFRPSYFPFVEPGVEIDMEWSRKDGAITWLEIAGAGQVHPNVLRAVGYDPETVDYSDPALPPGMTAEKGSRRHRGCDEAVR